MKAQCQLFEVWGKFFLALGKRIILAPVRGILSGRMLVITTFFELTPTSFEFVTLTDDVIMRGLSMLHQFNKIVKCL